MRYEVFRNKTSDIEAFRECDALYKRVMREDKVLCNAAQRNLGAGIFVNGELHPRLEQGPLHFQNQVRETLARHREKERRQGREIHPARQEMPAGKSGKASRRDIGFCEGVSCGIEGNPKLSW